MMPEQKTLTSLAWAEMLLPALIWGGSFLSNRLALDKVGVFTTVAFRVSGVCAILWV